MAVINLTNEYQEIDTANLPRTDGFEGQLILSAKVDSSNPDELKSYISVLIQIKMNYLYRSDTVEDRRTLIIKQDNNIIYNDTIPHISDTKIDGIWGYYGNYSIFTVYEWTNIPISCNSDGTFDNIELIGEFISKHHDITGDDLSGTCSLTALEIGGKLSVKTSSGWQKGQVFVKTSDGWKKAKAVYVKTSDGWKKAK